jgi:hypothetical protein
LPLPSSVPLFLHVPAPGEYYDVDYSELSDSLQPSLFSPEPSIPPFNIVMRYVSCDKYWIPSHLPPGLASTLLFPVDFRSFPFVERGNPEPPEGSFFTYDNDGRFVLIHTYFA